MVDRYDWTVEYFNPSIEQQVMKFNNILLLHGNERSRLCSTSILLNLFSTVVDVLQVLVASALDASDLAWLINSGETFTSSEDDPGLFPEYFQVDNTGTTWAIVYKLQQACKGLQTICSMVCDIQFEY